MNKRAYDKRALSVAQSGTHPQQTELILKFCRERYSSIL